MFIQTCLATESRLRTPQANTKISCFNTDGVEHKILLESDWYMSRMQCSLHDYWQEFESLFPDLFEMMTGENTVRFLKSDASTNFSPQFFDINHIDLIDKYRHIFGS